MLRELGNQRRDDPRSRRQFRRWEAPGKRLLNFRLAPVGGRLDQLIRVFRREMRCEEANGGKMEFAFSQGRKERRESPGRSSCLNALRSRGLGKAQRVNAIGMH